jgi:hypothetical protein
MIVRDKCAFYLLSFTWGLPLTLVGCIVAIVLLATGHKPKKWGYCYYFEVGQNWGGLELGPIFLTDKSPSVYTKNHEHGHAFQNCKFGPLMPFVVSLPSAVRYWYRRIRTTMGNPVKTSYYSVWFESEASTLGKEFMNWHNTQQND